MFKKYEWIVQRYEELSIAIGQPELIADQERYQAALRERTALEEQVDAWQRYQQLLRHMDEAQALLHDPDFAEEAAQELAQLQEQRVAQEQTLRVLLLPRDPNDQRNVMLEIRAATGGEEAALFGADLMRMYDHYAARRGWRFEPVSINDTELGGVKEGVFTVSGTDVYARLKYESGTHRVQRVPVTDTTGKKQTSTCTVAILPEAKEVELVIDPGDLKIDVYRSTGHGGQCVNTTDSAVRITHLPTGTVVTCQDQKSQLKNRDKAMKVLRARLLTQLRADADAEHAENRRSQVGTGDRSERIRTYNFHESRVTDHRIGLTLYRIDDIMNGDLDEIIDALRTEEQAMLLQQMSSN